MPKPPGAMEVKTRKYFLNLIIPRSSASSNYLQENSQDSPEINSVLPEHLDKSIDLPWTSENSRRIDLWLWYTQLEFELVGGIA